MRNIRAEPLEAHMRTTKTILLSAALLSLNLTAAAKDNVMQGTIVSENSVDCGTKGNGKKKQQTTDLMCQEYVIRTQTTEYHVRQEKQAHKEMLPVNAPVELTIDKDKMKFKVNGKSYEMLVVSEAAAPAAAPAATPAPATKP
jgi:hypothetical protein